MFTMPPCSGYPQALSGKLTQLTNVADMQKNVLFFGTALSSDFSFLPFSNIESPRAGSFATRDKRAARG
jgi:hypothetical protein